MLFRFCVFITSKIVKTLVFHRSVPFFCKGPPHPKEVGVGGGGHCDDSQNMSFGNNRHLSEPDSVKDGGGGSQAS